MASNVLGMKTVMTLRKKNRENMKTYPIVCPSCNGERYISHMGSGYYTSATKVCPACNGSGIVMCQETPELLTQSE